MDTQTIRDKVIQEFVDTLGVEKTSVIPSKSLTDDFDMDDLDVIDLMNGLEDTLGIEIDEEVFEKLTTVGDVITYCEKLDCEKLDSESASV